MRLKNTIIMPDMIDNICNYRSTDQAVVEAPDFTSTSYCPPNSREGDKIVCVAPVTPPHKSLLLLVPRGGPVLPPPPTVGPALATVGPSNLCQVSHPFSPPLTSGLLQSSPYRTTRWTAARRLWLTLYTPPLPPPLLLPPLL